MAGFNPDLEVWTGEVIRVHVQWRGVTQIETYQTHFDYMSPFPTDLPATSAELAAAANEFDTALTAGFQACTVGTVNIIAYIAESLRNPAVLLQKKVVSYPGAITGDYLPPFNQVTLQIKTTTRGKHGRGRRQLAAIPESFNQNGYLTAAGVTACEGLANLLEGSLPITGPAFPWRPCLARRVLPVVNNLWTVRAQLVNTIDARDTIGSQDRRAWGRGS